MTASEHYDVISRERLDAFVSSGWDYISTSRSSLVIDRPDAAQID
jgi:hypothetical protein